MAIPAPDRERLERLLSYAARPPLCSERLKQQTDGRLLYRLKRRWLDGTTQVVLEPLELIGRLTAMVPPPRFHLLRYHGVLTPMASWRDRVVPRPPHVGPEMDPTAQSASRSGRCCAAPRTKRSRYYSWAELMRRVFAIDAFVYSHCGSRVTIVAAIQPTDTTRALLECLGLPARASPIATARRNSRHHLFLDDPHVIA